MKQNMQKNGFWQRSFRPSYPFLRLILYFIDYQMLTTDYINKWLKRLS